jgi:NAD(P)-dependent dehydrogenase (short-subunit alcohol dehydrogenase family)
VRALVTGAEGGIGRAICARIEREGYDVTRLDVLGGSGFDVADPRAWDDVEPAQLAFLNAGVLTGEGDVAAVTDEQYRRILCANVDGVVFGVRSLARTMQDGGSIVATASLAGLTDMVSDPIYAATKHFVVGFVRSAAPQLVERGIRLNAVCPGIVDTPMVDVRRDELAAVGFPLLSPEDVADAAWLAATSGRSGEAWVVQPGRTPEPFRYPGVPGPRVEGSRGSRPPL